MSSKVIVTALAVVALQALWVQTSSIGVAAEDSNPVGLDLADKDVLRSLIGGLNVGDLTQHIMQRTSSFDSGVGKGVAQALKNILTWIVNPASGYQKAVDAALARVQNETAAAIDAFAQTVKAAVNSIGLNPAFAICQAKQPSLGKLIEAYAADLQGCTKTSFSSVQASIGILDSMQTRALALVRDIRQAFLDCLPSGWLAIPCFAAKTPEFFAEASGLAINATRLAVDINRELRVNIPQKNAACTDAALAKRTAEGTNIVDGIKKCLKGTINVNPPITSPPRLSPLPFPGL